MDTDVLPQKQIMDHDEAVKLQAKHDEVPIEAHQAGQVKRGDSWLRSMGVGGTSAGVQDGGACEEAANGGSRAASEAAEVLETHGVEESAWHLGRRMSLQWRFI